MKLKRAVLTALTSSAVAPIWRPFVTDCVAVFMLHRFTDLERDVDGASIVELRDTLAFLRRHDFPIASLQDLSVPGDPASRGTRPTVVFTIDDGYADFARIAAPVFAEFDCPVTVFLTTGPVERPMWLWWDRVEYTLCTTTHRRVEFEIGGRLLRAQWESKAERIAAAATISEALKFVPNAQKESAVAELAVRLDVEVPATTTPDYAAMTWSDVRRCAARGVTFAPHTVNHPMLPQVSDAEAEWEILESWRVLRANCDATVPVFCYPNGAYTAREVSILSRSDLSGAVTTHPRYAARRVFQARHGDARFTIPRFAYTEDRPRLLSVLTGFERVNLALQDGRDGWHAIGAGNATATA